MNPILSIVTITKDDPRGLKRTLGSLKSWLSDDRIEHVLVTAENSAAGEVSPDSRVVVQHSSGISGAFNEGLECCHGEWVWYLNGGDALHPGLSRQWLLALLAATSADIVAGTVHYDGDIAPRPARLLREQWPPLICWIPHPAALVRREVLMRAGGFDERWRVAMDFDLWLRLLHQDVRVDVVSIPFAFFDVSGVSQRPGTRGVLAQENAAVLWQHKSRLICAGLITVRHILGTLWRAWRQK
jgi:glycosyltransferase involved in cell wall biosynthesis